MSQTTTAKGRSCRNNGKQLDGCGCVIAGCRGSRGLACLVVRMVAISPDLFIRDHMVRHMCTTCQANQYVKYNWKAKICVSKRVKYIILCRIADCKPCAVCCTALYTKV